MLPRPTLPLVVVVALVAGCLAPAAEGPTEDALQAGADDTASGPPVEAQAIASPADAPPLPDLPLLRSGNRTAQGSEPLLWQGAKLDAEGKAEERFPFAFEAPEGLWEQAGGAVVVSVRWPLYHEKWFTLEVLDASGKLVAEGVEASAALGVGPIPLLNVPGSASVAALEDLAPGEYVAVVRATQGASAYEGAIHVQPAPAGDAEGGARDVLPNLVTLPPMDLRIGETLGAPDLPGPVRGCDPDETAERQVVRCLRFSNGIGNVGEGALEMRLSKEDGPKALAMQGGRFVQRVYASDGSFRDQPAGDAEFHPAHGHFHYSGAATFRVHAYDLETQTRGDALKEGRKTGFCFGDLSLVLPGLTATTAPRFDASGCLDPYEHDAWVTGLSPNWYDRYHFSWFDQFVDVGGLADGVYELVSTANHDGSILETTTEDNEASAVFRMTGDKVEVLSAKASVPAAP